MDFSAFKHSFTPSQARTPNSPAVILFSGGLDSTTILALAKQLGYRCYALSVHYGQKHSSELDAAKRIAQSFGVERHEVIQLSMALAWAESLGSIDVFYGANAVDYSGYPDCRPEYVKSFEAMANLATKVGVESTDEQHRFRIHAPIISMSKAQIIQLGQSLGIDYSQTVSCYQANAEGKACGVCESCQLRKAGFKEA
ncbi:MAG: 7-cyano-7-deazaguanine synthase, partial [Burkholderiaceae bacterium]|nr:7-cyano-7-deazaguanine synthase [Burkholderiaceae bacterium]